MKTKRPYDVKDTEEFLEMESDNAPGDPHAFTILHNGTDVSIHFLAGEGGWISILRDQFKTIVDWYMTPQKLKQPQTEEN